MEISCACDGAHRTGYNPADVQERRRRTQSVIHIEGPHTVPPTVVLVGLPPMQRRNVRVGFFGRCGLEAVDRTSLDEACELLLTLSPDAVVLDGRRPELQRLSDRLLWLLAQTAVTPSARARLLVLDTSRIRGSTRLLYEGVGCLFVRQRQQSMRELVRLVRRECGLSGDCCGPTAGAPARRSAGPSDRQVSGHR